MNPSRRTGQTALEQYEVEALTTRHDPAYGIAAAVDTMIAQGIIGADQMGFVSMSTTLATNALVEGQDGRVDLVMVGFAEADLDRGGRREADLVVREKLGRL